ncbi:MAG: SusC/RagA family TonB-linked outer membrane protein [Bacteroidota bacterium]
MKKLLTYSRSRNYLFKYDLKLKLSTFFIVFTFFALQANDSYAQRTKLSMDLDQATVGEFIDEIETISEFKFTFKTSEVDLDRKFSLKADNWNIERILEKVFSGTKISYIINKRNILLKPAPSNVDYEEDKGQTSVMLQEITVTGKVTDSDGMVLLGASILEKGTTNGTTSDFDGLFSIDVSDPNAILEVSYIGFSTLEVPLDGRTELTIALRPDVAQLDAVVVVGYGDQKSSEVSASIAQVATEDLEVSKRPVATLESSLVGSSPGLIIDQGSGQLGTEAGIQVRAASALEQKNALVLVDGFESSLENINPYDIESVSILKDAAATAIYGARGANGVVLVTTKTTRKNQRMSVTYSTNTSWQQPNVTADLANSQEFMEFFNEAQLAETLNADQELTPDDVTLTYSDEDIARAASGFYPETNWVEELYSQSALQTTHNLEVSGGSENIGYLVNLGYLNQDGISLGNDQLERFTVRVKVDADINDWLTIGANIFNGYRELNNVPLNTGNGLRGQPFFPVTLDSGPFAGTFVFKGSTSGEENPIAQALSGSFDNTVSDELNMQLYGTIKLLKGLELEGRLSYLTDNDFREIWNNPYSYIILDEADLTPIGNPVPIANEDRNLQNVDSRSRLINTLVTLNYDTTFGNAHNFEALLGFQAESGEGRSFSASRFDFILDDPQSINLGSQIDGFGNDSDFFNERSTLSYFSRLSYNYRSKYLMEVNMRADASSNFVRDKWGYFPAFSVGWNVDRENFLMENNFITRLKLRASWGINGDDGSLSGVETAITNPNGIAFGGATQPTIFLSDAVNPNLTWETSEKTNLGVDLSLWNGKLTFTGDYFIDNREDIITRQLTSLESGLTGSGNDGFSGGILANVYDAKSWGWEINVGHNSNIGDVGFFANVNLSYYNSEITSGEGDAPLNLDENNYQIEGLPILGNLFGFETDGYFDSQAEIEAHQIDQSEVVITGDDLGRYLGGLKYIDQLTVDSNGDGIPDQADGIINEDDRVVLLENSNDNYRLGANFGFTYKGFGLSTRIYGALSGYEWWNQGAFLNAFTSAGVGPFDYQRDTWRPNNTDPLFPQAYLNNRPYDPNVSELIKDRSYIKWKNVNLSYTFGRPFLDQIGFLKGLDVYVSFENLGVIWTNYPAFEYGFDPEFGANGFNYPLAVKTSFGLNVQF